MVKKKRRLITILSLFLFLIFAGCETSPRFAPRNALAVPLTQLNESMESTVIILSMSGERAAGCTGFFVNSNNIVTASHCVSPQVFISSPLGTITVPGGSSIGSEIEIITYQQYRINNYDKSETFRVVVWDPDIDIAILERIDLPLGTFRVASISRASGVRIGQFVYSVGHPVYMPYNVSQGFISRNLLRERNSGNRTLLISNADIFRGNSGGPVFDSRGRVLAMTVQIAAGQSYLHRAVFASTLRQVLREHRIPPYLM